MRHTAPPDASGLQRQPLDRLSAALTRYRRNGRHARIIRRIAAALLLVAAGVIAVTDSTADTADGATVQVVARDLPTGATLQASDLRTIAVRSPPDGALPAQSAAAGRVLAGPIRKGEIVTDVRLLSAAGPSPGPGQAAVPVRPDDSATVALLTPGMRVAVIGVDQTGAASTLTDQAVVLWIPEQDPGTIGAPAAGRLVVLGVPRAVADTVAATAITGSIGLRFA